MVEGSQRGRTVCCRCMSGFTRRVIRGLRFANYAKNAWEWVLLISAAGPTVLAVILAVTERLSPVEVLLCLMGGIAYCFVILNQGLPLIDELRAKWKRASPEARLQVLRQELDGLIGEGRECMGSLPPLLTPA